MNDYPRETVEYVPFETLTVDGQVFTGFQFSVSKVYDRPTIWANVTTVDGQQAFLLNAPVMGPGTYKVWVKVSDAPEVPVIDAGEFRIT